LQDRQDFGDFDRVPPVTEEKKLYIFNRIKPKQVHEAADNTDTTRNEQMQRLLAKFELLADLERASPMSPEKDARPGNKPMVRPSLHKGKFSGVVWFDEPVVFANGPDPDAGLMKPETPRHKQIGMNSMAVLMSRFNRKRQQIYGKMQRDVDPVLI